MPVWHHQLAFNAGEVSPLLHGRADFARRAAALAACENFLPHATGALIRRPGTAFVEDVSGVIGRPVLVPFVVERDTAFALLLSEDGQGRAYLAGTLASTFAHRFVGPGELRDADGRPQLKWTQLGDLLVLVSPTVRPQLLERNGTTFVDRHLPFDGGPWEEMNDDRSRAVYADGETGTVTLTAVGGPIWGPEDVGSLFRVWARDLTAVKPWEASRKIGAPPQLRRVGVRVYRSVATPETGSRTGLIAPSHTEGRDWDGDPWTDGSGNKWGQLWEYLHPGYGWGEITAVAPDGMSCTLEVRSRLPHDVVGAGNETWRWQRGAWSDRFGWPEAVTFAYGRLWFARGARLWASRADDFFRFDDREHGEIKADCALDLLLPEVGRILNLAATRQGVIAFGSSSLYRVGPANTAQVLGTVTDGARNVELSRLDAVPGTNVPPLVARGRLLYAAGRTVRELAYRLDRDTLESADLTVLAEHMFPLGALEAAWTGAPDSTAWWLRPDGTLAALTYAPEQQVVAWSRHRIGDRVLALCAVPSHEDQGDTLYLLVERTTPDATFRWIEHLAPRWRIGDPPALSRHLDAHVVIELASEIDPPTGAAHLEGWPVKVLVDGMEYEAVWFEGGIYRLGEPVRGRLWVVGLPYLSRARLLEPLVVDRTGTYAVGHAKGISRVRVSGADCGPLWLRLSSAVDADRLPLGLGRPVDLPSGEPTPLWTGRVDVQIARGFEPWPYLALEADGALPAQLTHVGLRLEVGE